MGFRPMGRHPKINRRVHRPMRPHHAALERPGSPGNRLPVPPHPLAQRLRRRSRKSLQKIRLRNTESPRSLLHYPQHKYTLPKSSPPKRNAPRRPLDQTLQRYIHAPRPLHSHPQITPFSEKSSQCIPVRPNQQKIPPHIEFPTSIHYNRTRKTQKDNPT